MNYACTKPALCMYRTCVACTRVGLYYACIKPALRAHWACIMRVLACSPGVLVLHLRVLFCIMCITRPAMCLHFCVQCSH